jgi:von Willebrand factor type A domain/Aerotolerance regulator N-terminal/CARDB
MSFLNGLLLGGTVAGIIPLAVHLLHRRNKKNIPWGAMQFLISRTSTQQRRMQLKQWLLLALRISIPILLALCMARPFIEGLHASKDQLPTSVVLLIDDSASMASCAQEPSPFTNAKRGVELLIRKLPRGSEVSVVCLCEPSLPVVDLTVNLRQVIDRIKNLDTSPGTAQLSEGLETSASVLSKAHNAKRRVIILSDLQKSNWSDGCVEKCLQPIERLHAQNPTPTIDVFDAGSPDSENSAIEALDFTRLPVGVGDNLHFTATLRNYGSKARTAKRLEWRVDGELVATKNISIDAHASAQVALDHIFKQPGQHRIQVQTEADSQPTDDVLFASITVHEPIKVLIVNGRTSKNPMQNESAFLETALQPKTSSLPANEGIINPTVIDLNGLNAKAIAKHQSVVLADVRSLTQSQVNDLQVFVRSGGGLLVFPGNQTDVEWSNKMMHAGGLGLLPARMTSLKASELCSMGLSKTITPHRVLDPFFGVDGAFAEVKVQKWFLLQPCDSSGEGQGFSPTNALLNLEDGSPLLVERNFGSGVVIQSAIPCSPGWSNLPARQAYLPLIQRLVLYTCADSQPSPSVSVNQPVIAVLKGKSADQSVTLTSPDGASTQCLPRKQGDHSIAEFYGTRQLGFYSLNTGSGDIKIYAVNAPREESNPERLESKTFEKIALRMNAGIARTQDELLQSKQGTANGREIWETMVWLILTLLFAEMFLCQQFSVKQELRQ